MNKKCFLNIINFFSRVFPLGKPYFMRNPRGRVRLLILRKETETLFTFPFLMLCLFCKIIDSPKGDGNFTMSLLAVACNTDVVRLLILRKETETFHALLGVVCHFEVRLLILRKETETLSFPASTLSVAM